MQPPECWCVVTNTTRFKPPRLPIYPSSYLLMGYVCMCAYMSMCVHVWRLEYSLGCHLQKYQPLSLRQGLSLTWNLAIKLHWQASESQGTCLPHHCWDYKCNTHLHFQLFTWIWRLSSDPCAWCYLPSPLSFILVCSNITIFFSFSLSVLCERLNMFLLFFVLFPV